MNPLFECRNSFYLGNYQQCISAALKCDSGKEEFLECQIFMNRALIAQHKYKAVIEENKESHYSSSIKLCSLLARYKQTPKEGRNIIDELEQLLDDTCINDPFCLLLAGELYFLGVYITCSFSSSYFF
jgi:coatomer protein complex subunit epsilon